MRILITGAAGNLSTGLIERLEGRQELRLSDVVPVETAHEFVQVDVRDREAVTHAAKDVDLIVHTPAWHGIHLRSRSESEFWDLNVGGTFNMFQAAIANHVPRVVWMSSMSVHSRDNIYGLTKVVGEELCEFYYRVHGVRCILLRPADFTPYRNLKQYGERLLRGGVDRRDVHQAVSLAVENETVECEAFPILREDPFTRDDIDAWQRDPVAVLERHFPGARDLVERHELDLPSHITLADIAATKDRLGYRPRYNFITFLQDLKERDARGDSASWLQQG